MIKKKHLIVMFGLSLMLFCGGIVYAMTSVGVVNFFQTGMIDINLTEYQKNGSREELWVDNPEVLPGSIVSKIPRIHNAGSDCYVRVKLAFRENDELSEENLFGIGDDWLKSDDGYYYYTKVLAHDENVDIFQGLKIPEDFSQENEGTKFYIDIQVDAIQSKNFTPRFDMAAPWGDIEILACKKEGQYEVSSFKQSDTQTFRITYEGDSKELLKNSDDFFANIPALMPGDQYSDSVEIVNNGSEEIKLYFRSEALDTSELPDKILLKITTTIDGREKVFYSGNLRATQLSEDVILGILPEGSKGTFDFEIEVPAELNNEYSVLNSYVKWIFSTEPIKEESVSTKTANRYTGKVRTGDSANAGFYICLLGISLGVISVIGFKRLKRGNGEGNE